MREVTTQTRGSGAPAPTDLPPAAYPPSPVASTLPQNYVNPAASFAKFEPYRLSWTVW